MRSIRARKFSKSVYIGGNKEEQIVQEKKGKTGKSNRGML